MRTRRYSRRNRLLLARARLIAMYDRIALRGGDVTGRLAIVTGRWMRLFEATQELKRREETTEVMR